MSNALLLSTVNKLLVACPSGLYTIHEGLGSYAGATWDEEHFYVGIQNRASQGEAKDNRLLIFDKGLNLVDERTFPHSGPTAVLSVHDVFYWDGKVYVVSTFNSRIIAWQPSGRLEKVFVSPLRKPDEWSINTNVHLNSLWCDGEYFYVVEHNHGPSLVKKFDLNWQWQATYHIGHESHNIYVEGGVMHVCSSWHRVIAIRDLATNGERWIHLSKCIDWQPGWDDRKLPYVVYPRGLARTADKWFVGLSATARRGDREKGDSCVAVFDTDWHKLNEIVVPDTGGIGTGGVRVIDETDYAHNRIRCPWDGTIGGKAI